MSEKDERASVFVETLKGIVGDDSEKVNMILVAMHDSMSEDYRQSLKQEVLDEGFAESVQPLIVSNLSQAINEVTVAAISISPSKQLLHNALQHIDVARNRLIEEIARRSEVSE